MEFIRSRIENQLMSLTGLSLGQLDLENPKCMATSAAC
jgi:hypothetical protein